MEEQIIKEWLDDWASMTDEELHSFAAEHDQSQDVAEAVYMILEERSEHAELLEPICIQLFGFYRSRETVLQKFALQFLPSLIYIYLNAVANGEKKNHKCIETLLIGLYNLEVMDENGQPKVVSFRLPSLAQASIYHEPLSLAPAFLTESSLRRWEECNTKLVSWGPLPQVEALNAQNRAKVMTALFFVFNRQLSLLPRAALRQLCAATSRLVTQGFTHLTSRKYENPLPHAEKRALHRSPLRIPVTSQLLLELVQGVYFAMFNEFYTLALQAVNDIGDRARFEGYPDVLLVTGAITNSLQANPSGRMCDGPMGISVALSPATNTVTLSKSMITNASFRTKKLPDDIPIQVGGTTETPDALNSISEETESEINSTQRNTALRNSKSKLPSFPGLGKKVKDKEKDNKEKMVAMKTMSNSGESIKRQQPSPKDMMKTHSKTSLHITSNGDNVDFPSPMLQKKMSSDMRVEGNGSVTVDDVILQNNDNADGISQMTSESMDMDSASVRFTSMQVSSV